MNLDRRTLLRMLGIAAIAPALPAVARPRRLLPTSIGPLLLDAYTIDGKLHTMEADAVVQAGRAIVSFRINFTGTVWRVMLRRDSVELCSVTFPTTNFVRESTACIEISFN